jgi:hypothetical protein
MYIVYFIKSLKIKHPVKNSSFSARLAKTANLEARCPMAHAHKPSSLEGRDRRTAIWGQPGQKR